MKPVPHNGMLYTEGFAMADSFIWTPITLLGNLLFITIYVILLHTVLTRRVSTAVTVAGCAACWVLSLLCSTLLPYASLAGYLSLSLIHI